MPRYYCDYCDTYLTHDSPSVRKQHNSGYKHKANIRSYYQKFEEQQTQTLIDQRIKEHLGQTAVYQQIGAAYNQHLATFPGGRPRLPIMPLLGAVPPHLATGIRPILLVPVPGVPGYATTPSMVAMQPPSGSSLPIPPSGAAPGPPNPGAPTPPNTSASAVPAHMYSAPPSEMTPLPLPATTATAGSHSYPQPS